MIKGLMSFLCFLFAINSFAETDAELFSKKIKAASDSYAPFMQEIIKDMKTSLMNHGKSNLERCDYRESIDLCISRITARYDSLRKQAATDGKNRDFKSIQNFYFSKTGDKNYYERGQFNRGLTTLYNVPDSELVGEYIYHTGIYPLVIEYNDQRCGGFFTRALRKLSNSSIQYSNPFFLGSNINGFKSNKDGDVLASHGYHGIAAFVTICEDIYSQLPEQIDRYEKIVVNEYKNKILNQRASIDIVIGNIAKTRELSKAIRQRLGVKECCSMYSEYPSGSEFELIKKRGFEGPNFKFLADKEKLIADLLVALNQHASEVKKISAGRAIEDWIENGINFKNLPETIKVNGNWFIQKALDVTEKSWKSKRDYINSNSIDDKTRNNMISNYKILVLMDIIEEVRDISGCGSSWTNNKAVLASYLMLKKSSQMMSPNLSDAYTAGNIVLTACAIDKPEWSGFLLPGIDLK